MEGPLAALALDENKVVYVVGSTKENSNMGKSSEKGFFWPIQMPSMWFTRGDDGTLTQPLPCGIGWPQSSGKLTGIDLASPTL